MKLVLGKLGEVETKIPKSLATCADFGLLYGQGHPGQLMRLSAAAIAVCLDHAKVLPAYPVTVGDPIAYGHIILDRLFDAGVDYNYIFSKGSELVRDMNVAVYSVGGVDETVNFSSAKEEA